jgi:hypothetical protein
MTRPPSVLIVLLVGLSLTACGERDEPEITSTTSQSQFDIRGDWRGELTQQGMKPFEVQATIASLERFKDNTVRYSGIKCSGTWEFIGATETAYRLHEVIDSGQSKDCKGQGTVSLTPLAQNSLDYEFRGGGVVSKGDLRRVSPAKAG